MKEKKEMGDNITEIMERLRFKSLPYDEKSAYQRLEERLDKTIHVPHAGKEFQRWKFLFAAASLALLLVSSLYLLELKQANLLVYYETIAVPNAKTKLILSDSTTVWLNANASIRYPREFGEQVREVEVSGETFFDVQKEAERPFIVQLEGMRIQVLGTSFTIDTETDPDLIKISLLEGKIALFSNSNLSDTADQILYPGQQAIFNKLHNNLKVIDVETQKYTSWVTGVFVFNSNTLEEIADELQRAFHVKIHIENERMRNKTFYATFAEKETLDEILSVLQISAHYTIEKRKGEIYLK